LSEQIGPHRLLITLCNN